MDIRTSWDQLTWGSLGEPFGKEKGKEDCERLRVDTRCIRSLHNNVTCEGDTARKMLMHDSNIYTRVQVITSLAAFYAKINSSQ